MGCPARAGVCCAGTNHRSATVAPRQSRPAPCCAQRVFLKRSHARSSCVTSGRPRVTVAEPSSATKNRLVAEPGMLTPLPLPEKVWPDPHTLLTRTSRSPWAREVPQVSKGRRTP